ncbi:unnamed protein product [Closterium sp. NIES-53]
MASTAAEDTASKPLHAVVCGGGVIGACTAFYLAEKGVKVTVVEKCRVACAASGKAGGFLALDWCSGPTGKLAQLSYLLHEQLAQQFGERYGYRKVHTLSLQVAEPKNPSAAGGQRTKVSSLPEWIDGPVRGVQTMGSPATTAQVHPQLFTETLLRVAGERHGVEVQLGEVQDVTVAPVGDSGASSKVTGVIVDGATVTADIVVFALGPWSGKNRLIARLGQITGQKANSVVVRPNQNPEAVTNHMLFLQYRTKDGRHADPEIYPRPSGEVYLCSVTEGDNYLPDNPEEITTTPGVPEFLKRVGATVSSALADVTIVKEQACFLPCSQDNVPVIGHVPGMEGAYVATGHSCWGILNAPATGLAVAELAVDGMASCVDLRPFDPARFFEEENEEPEDTGMPPSDDEGDDDYGNDDAEEEVQPVTRPPERIALRASAADKGNGKAAAPPARQEPRKKRSAASVERCMWSDKESTIFAAARWFTKDELEPLKGKQGTQYWVRLLAHIKESNPGWCRNVNALQKQWRNLMLFWKEYKRGDGGSGNGSVEKPPWWPYLEVFNKDTAAAALHAVDGGGATNVNVQAGMEVPSSSQPVTSTPTFTAPPPQTDATPKRAGVHETATMQAAKLVSATIKDCHGDAMARIEGLIREWMAQDLRLARERMTESAPPHVHREATDFSPPPPRGESAPPPGRAAPDAVGGDAGDVNTVTPVDDDVEIWVRGADD